VPDRVIDLRLDTVTKPSPEMMRAIALATLGDDVFGDCPTTRALEEKTAETLGLPDAMFVPSGTMANLIAALLHCRPGDEAIVEAGAHPFNYEVAGAAAYGGVQFYTLIGDRGILTADQVRAAVRPDNVHVPRTALVMLENTHNRGGGTVYPFDTFADVANLAKDTGIPLHLDGARIMNASVASGRPASDYASLSTTTTICFSKGLGAPIGSALAGSAGLIAEARRIRKRLGGGMRQAGVAAAAALYALEHNVERLAEDHDNAKLFAEGISDLPPFELDPTTVETNIIMIPLSDGAPHAMELQKKAEKVGVRIIAITPASMRAVTHLDVTRSDVEDAVRRLREAFR
jgi:threonine aldolase